MCCCCCCCVVSCLPSPSTFLLYSFLFLHFEVLGFLFFQLPVFLYHIFFVSLLLSLLLPSRSYFYSLCSSFLLLPNQFISHFALFLLYTSLLLQLDLFISQTIIIIVVVVFLPFLLFLPFSFLSLPIFMPPSCACITLLLPPGPDIPVSIMHLSACNLVLGISLN